MKRLLVAFAALAIATPAAAQSGTWIGVWAAPPAPPTPNRTPSFENQTIEQVAHITAPGQAFRIRFTNAYGDKPLKVGAASVALGAGAPQPLTFSGATDITIPAHGVFYSDPVKLAAGQGADLDIRIYLPEATGPCTCHPQGTATAKVFAGDTTKGGGEVASTFTQRAFISGIEALEPQGGRTIVTFGDSITDGTRSTNDANSRWPDYFAARINAASDKPVGVMNEAISGNQVLGMGLPMFGEPALVRFDRDVMSVPNVTHMTVLEGINDQGMNRTGRPSPDQAIAGYRQIIARAHAHGIKVIIATLMPYEGASYYSEEGEANREKINDWIRTSGEFDGVIDFDALMRDPANPRKLKADLQSGDWLHPNDAGYKLMADSIDLGLFR